MSWNIITQSKFNEGDVVVTEDGIVSEVGWTMFTDQHWWYALKDIKDYMFREDCLLLLPDVEINEYDIEKLIGE